MASSAETLYRWHARPGAFERLTPPWQPVRVLSRTGGIETHGSRVTLSVAVGPFQLRWVSEHRDAIEGRQFRDVQIEGPFASWEHTHRFEPTSDGSSVLEDEVHYTLPLGALGRFVAGKAIRRDLERMFRYRHQTTLGDLRMHARFQEERRMKVLVSGSSGLVGGALVPFLTTGGHEALSLARPGSRAGEDAIRWDPKTGPQNPAQLEGFDAVVHLAGESIASGRWTAGKKARIRDSRVDGTRALSRALAKLDRPPRVLVSASAIGYYGDRGSELLHRDSENGEGFLAEVCREWEVATAPAAERGIRVVNLRIGVVLSPKGGALAKMLMPFRVGVGGVLGRGDQYMSWITLDDLLGVILHAAMDERFRGPVNAVSTQPVTNREFTETLGRVLKRPTFLPMPTFAARAVFGEMADELLLASIRVAPDILVDRDFEFRHSNLEAALGELLGRATASLEERSGA